MRLQKPYAIGDLSEKALLLKIIFAQSARKPAGIAFEMRFPGKGEARFPKKTGRGLPLFGIVRFSRIGRSG